MKTRTRHLLSVLLPALFVAVALAPTAAAQTVTPTAKAAIPAASVDILSPAKVGRFDTAVIDLAQRCRAGAVVQELVVEVKQGNLTGSKAGPLGVRCDGAWHRIQVEVFSSTGDKFVPGKIDVSARLTVLDPDSLDPLPQGRDSARITLLRAADIRIGTEGAVGRFQDLTVPIIYRCQKPWIVSGLNVSVTQNGVSGFTFRDTGLVCDARWHHVNVGVGPPPEDTFTSGFADVDVSLDIQDPVEFDPVDQVTASKHLWIAPAARAVVDNAVLKPDGSVVVTLSLRCQRPWVVAEWSASVSQKDGRVFGSTFGDTGIVCNQKWQKIVTRFTGSEPFTPGRSIVSGGLYVQDPIDFDPVEFATDTRTFNLHH